MKPIIQKVVVGALIINDGKILILQRADNDTFGGMWELPSGKKDDLEKAEDAIKREVLEEAEIKVEVLKPLSVFNYIVEKDEEIRDATQITYLCKMLSESDVQLSKEHQNFAWIGKDEIDNYNLSKETKDTIAKAFEINI